MSADLATTRTGSRTRALQGMYRAGWRSVLIYRGDLFVGIVGMIIQVVLTITVWRVVYGDRDQVAGITENSAVAYAVIAASFQAIVMPWQFSSLPQRIMLGQIGVDLTRPLGLIGQSLAQSVGTLVGRVPIGIAGVLVGLVVGALQPPSSLINTAGWLVSTTLGMMNVLMINLAVSMTAFWTLEIGGPLMVYRFGSAFLSGALIPIWFMPDWLQAISAWLPFQAQMFAPLTIWFGTTTGWHIVRMLAIQLAWVLILGLLLKLIFARAIRQVVVLGG